MGQSADIIRQLASVIEQVDVAPAEVVSEFIKLDRADATKVTDMLKEIFEQDSQPTGQPGVRSVRVPPSVPQPVPIEAGGEMPGLSEEAVIVGKIKLTADVRTNRIHVVTRPINMPFIRRLIREFDANVEFGKPVTRYLKYVSAAEVLPVLVQALTEPGAEAVGAAPGAPGQQQQQPIAQPSPPTGVAGAPGTESTLNISEELATEPVDTTPQAVTIGNAKLIADQRANSIIVLGNREVVVKVQKILDEMDVKAPQVALSTVIGELRLGNNEEFGVDYFLRVKENVAGTAKLTGVPPFIGGRTTGQGEDTRIRDANIFNPATIESFTQLAASAATGTNIYLAAGSTLASVVHILNQTGRFKTISRPMVFTSNNKKAIIASGREIPVPVSTLTNVQVTAGNQAAVAASVEFKRVALQLEVVPLINSEKEVSLDILQKIDNVLVGAEVDISGNEIPTISTRYIRSHVSAPNGATIILGGLIEDRKETNRSSIPYLSRIPVLGALFRNTNSAKERTELIILMCPQVTLTKLERHRLRQKWEEDTHFGPEIDQSDCADCPKTGAEKQLPLPPPDIPAAKDF